MDVMAFLFLRRRRKQRPVRPTIRLELQRLEDRCVPSAGYQQINLVGHQDGMAPHTDPNLNGWGMDFAPGGPFVVANTFSTGLATFYDRSGQVLPQTVTVPAAPSQPFGPVGHPTGVVYNPTSDFVISANGKSAPARFLFDTFDGLICGWNPDVDPTHAIVMVDKSTEAPHPAVYTGLTIAQNSQGHNVLYAADFGLGASNSNNRIDMFDGGFHSLGSFTDPNVAGQYPGNTPFQVENVNGKLYVTYGSLTPPFGGVVDVFDTDGHLLTPNHFAANAPGAGPLENPWAVVQAPAKFGTFSNDLLIGNVEGAGNINAFDPVTGAFLGQLQQPNGTPIAIPGLWDLTFGGDSSSNGLSKQLYFDAGPNAPNPPGNGLFGMILAAGRGNQPPGMSLGDPAPATAAATAQPQREQGQASSPGVVRTEARPAAPAALFIPAGALQDRASASDQSTLPPPSQRAATLLVVQTSNTPPTGAAVSSGVVTARMHRRLLDLAFTDLDGTGSQGVALG
jgi:uncharacterized protein (TIGR03118 family)